MKAAEAGNTARTAGRSIKTTAKGLKTAVKGAVTSVKALGALLASAGGFILVFIVIIGIIAGDVTSEEDKGTTFIVNMKKEVKDEAHD